MSEPVVEKYYTVDEVADILQVTPATVRVYLKDGRLGSYRPPGTRRYRVTLDHIQTFIKTNKGAVQYD